MIYWLSLHIEVNWWKVWNFSTTGSFKLFQTFFEMFLNFKYSSFDTSINELPTLALYFLSTLIILSFSSLSIFLFISIDKLLAVALQAVWKPHLSDKVFIVTNWFFNLLFLLKYSSLLRNTDATNFELELLFQPWALTFPFNPCSNFVSFGC